GNHDLALVEALDGKGRRKHVLRADRFGIVQLANLLKFAEAFARTGGGRRGLVMPSEAVDPVPFGRALDEARAAVRPLLDGLGAREVPRPILNPLALAARRAARAFEHEIQVARE